MIIDCHCHAGKGDGLTGPWDTAAPLEKYVRRARAAGIDKTVLFAAFHVAPYGRIVAGLGDLPFLLLLRVARRRALRRCTGGESDEAEREQGSAHRVPYW